MRLHLYLSPNERPVPFDYQHHLTGAFHKWLGANDLHDALSLYSLSWLYEGRARGGALEFPRGAHWFLSVHDESLVEPLVNSALRDPEVCGGMRVQRIEQQATPRFGPRFTFKVGSPVLARSKEDEAGRVRHYLYSDPEADAVLTATLRHKLDCAGLGAPHNAATVSFDKTYRTPKTKLVTIKDIRNRASVCPVTVEGTPGRGFDVGGGAEITVPAPSRPSFKQPGLREGADLPNADPAVMRLDRGDFSMLFAGDAETEARPLKNNTSAAAKVLKTGRRGSRYATGAGLLRAVNPDAAATSCGGGDEYGRPDSGDAGPARR